MQRAALTRHVAVRVSVLKTGPQFARVAGLTVRLILPGLLTLVVRTTFARAGAHLNDSLTEPLPVLA